MLRGPPIELGLRSCARCSNSVARRISISDKLCSASRMAISASARAMAAMARSTDAFAAASWATHFGGIELRDDSILLRRNRLPSRGSRRPGRAVSRRCRPARPRCGHWPLRDRREPAPRSGCSSRDTRRPLGRRRQCRQGRTERASGCLWVCGQFANSTLHDASVGIARIERNIDRLIGIGVSALSDADGADFADLIDRRTAEAEQAMDRLRERFGDDAVVKGLAFDRDDDGLEE